MCKPAGISIHNQVILANLAVVVQTSWTASEEKLVSPQGGGDVYLLHFGGQETACWWTMLGSWRGPTWVTGALIAYHHVPCYSALIQCLHLNKVTQMLGNTKKTGWSNTITAYSCLNEVIIKECVKVWVQGRSSLQPQTCSNLLEKQLCYGGSH